MKNAALSSENKIKRRNKLSKKKKILISVISVLLILAIAGAIVFACFAQKYRGTKVEISYNETFSYPADFRENGTATGENAEELFFSCLKNMPDFCYIGKMSGDCWFNPDEIIHNEGKEIVKKYNEDYYSYCQTSSIGDVPLIKDISVNSAKRSYLTDGRLFVCDVNEDKRFKTDDTVDWSGLQLKETADNVDSQVKNIKEVIPFVATQDTVIDGDNDVYLLDGKRYFTLTIDLSVIPSQEFLQILKDKLSSEAVNMGLSLINLANAAVDVSQVKTKMVVEVSEINGQKRITGRDLIMQGDIKIKSIIKISVGLNMSMSAVVKYEKDFFEITDGDLLK